MNRHKAKRSKVKRAVVLMVAAVFGVVCLGMPASAKSAGGPFVNYVAVGDSHGSGVGLGDYDPASGECLRSPHAYAPQWKSRYYGSFTFAACSGATTHDVNEKQLGGLVSSTNLVSVSIGGNDAGFSQVVGACRFGTDADCDAAVEQGLNVIRAELPARLDQTYALIRSRAPRAEVVVLGYPHMFELGAVCVGDEFPESHRARLNQAADVLADVTRARVKAAGPGFTFADTRPYFAGHGVCSADPWIDALRADPIESYHPNRKGHANAYVPALAWAYDVAS